MLLSESELAGLFARLTQRKQQVLHLVSEGLSNKEVGQQLFIAPSVVAEHLTYIYEEISMLESFVHERPNRKVLIRLFGGFIQRHPELNPFDEQSSVRAG